MTNAEQTMIATLQGLISLKSEDQIYILSSNEPYYKIWLEDLNKNYKVKYKTVKDPWQLVDKFKSKIDGYVLYSSVKEDSINNACTLASLKNSIAIDESIEAILNNHGITAMIEDCRETDKYWAFNNLWNSGLNHSTVIELPSDKYMSLRDYAILSKSLVFYEDDINDSTLREVIFSSMDDGGRVLGWGPDEHTNVSIASKFGIDMIAADWSYNLSVLSSYPSNPKTQNTTEKLIDYTKRLNEYMKNVDEHSVLILDNETFYNKDLWDKYTCNSNIDGLFYLNYDINNAYKGKIIWSNDKPIISCRDLLWAGIEDGKQLISNINDRINLGYTNIKDPNSYTFVYVHVWSNTMDNVNDVITKLNKNPKVRIVTPDTFVKLIQNNILHNI